MKVSLAFANVALLLLAIAVLSCQASTTAESAGTTTESAGTTAEGASTTGSMSTDGTTASMGSTEGATGSPGTDGATGSRGTDGATGSPGTDGATGATSGVTREITAESTRATETTVDSTGPTGGQSTATASTQTTRGPISDGTTAAPESTTTRTPTDPPTLEPAVGYTVSTSYYQVQGTTYTVRVSPFSDSTFTTKRVSRFLGIPYAQPPTQSRRFKSPEKLLKGPSVTVNATQHKPNCPQQGVAFSEDCLYYNIWTVQTSQSRNASLRYPVLVYIHGGRFETGYSSDPHRQGEELVSHTDVVVVTFNYRLGALGFLTLNRTSYSGNYGIQDQALALEVINEVIDSFGGNRSLITLMGLDAGSASIGFHMMNANSSALFSRAIMMGGSPMMPWSLTDDLEYVQLLSLLFISGGLNCPTVEPQLTQCLQAAPINQLIAMQANFTRFFRGLEFFPVIDGKTIPQDPWHAFSTGNFHSKDLLIGSTNDEGANIAEDALESRNLPILNINDSLLIGLIEASIQFYPRASKTLTQAGRQFLRFHFTQFTGANDGKANFATLGKAIGDWYLTCPVIQMAQFAERINRNVFLYYFTEKELYQDKWEASHGVDADYAFGVPTLASGIIYPDANKRLSERVMENFVQFAATGVPATPDLWNPLNNTVGSEMNYIDYNADARILGNKQRGYRLAECRFWNRTLAFVNGLQQPLLNQTTVAPTTTTTTTTTAAPTTRNPIGPCDTWALNSATATTMGVLLGTQAIMAVALGFVIYKWKSLAKISSDPIPMT